MTIQARGTGCALAALCTAMLRRIHETVSVRLITIALLLALVGTAMAISFGIKSPLDYSVFAASAGALLLALYPART